MDYINIKLRKGFTNKGFIFRGFTALKNIFFQMKRAIKLNSIEMFFIDHHQNHQDHNRNRNTINQFSHFPVNHSNDYSVVVLVEEEVVL